MKPIVPSSARWLALLAAIAIAIAGPAAAAPWLHRHIENSPAKKQSTCQNLAAKAVHSVASQTPMKIAEHNNRLGYTAHTTLLVDCISVGPNKMIYYVTAASTNLDDSKALRSRIVDTLRKLVLID